MGPFSRDLGREVGELGKAARDVLKDLDGGSRSSERGSSKSKSDTPKSDDDDSGSYSYYED